MAEFDYIIVGGGSAGCVMAHRLSARSANRVLLCEAGPDLEPGKEPAKIVDSYPGSAYLDPGYIWRDLKVSTEAIPSNGATGAAPRLRPYEQARVLGGGSSINGQFANRGAPDDYDEWVRRGVSGWGWEDVLPYFRKIEHDVDFDGPLHGQSGRIPIRRVFPHLWPEHAKGIARALDRTGMKFLLDQNGHYEEGYFPVAINNYGERRVSAAMAYLDAVTRMRPNLAISTETEVDGLIIEDGECVGVRASVRASRQEFRAKEVILCAGAIHSPTHLLKAGIGPASHLRDLGIDVVADVAGVGQGLMDHPSVALGTFVKPFARVNGYSRRHMFLAWRYSSNLHDAPFCDMFVAASTKSAWHAVGQQLGTFILFVNKTFSDRGSVRLRKAGAEYAPAVDFNLLSDFRDLDRLADGFRRLAALTATPEMREVCELPFPAVWGEKVRQVSSDTRRNRLYTALGARLLDGPAALRRHLMRTQVSDGVTLADILASDDTLHEFIRKTVVGVWHASSSCKMGGPNDPMAVTDNQGRVRKIGGLRVVDASIFPIVPRANLNVPAMMVAEKISDAMLAA